MLTSGASGPQATVAAQTPAPCPADLVLTNGKIVTVEDAQPDVQAMAVNGDTITALGSNADIQRFARGADCRAAEVQLAAARQMLARQEFASATTALEKVLDMLRADRSTQADEIRRAASALMEVSRAALAEEASAVNRVYRSGDPGVTDPTPLSYLPPKPHPDTPPEQLQVLEVMVNTDGTVDSAKFVMNRPSFRNSWWTAAAKAWRFEPAMKDRRPVRYVMRIVMDDSAAQR